MITVFHKMLCIYKQDGEKKISFQSEIGFVIKGNTTILKSWINDQLRLQKRSHITSRRLNCSDPETVKDSADQVRSLETWIIVVSSPQQWWTLRFNDPGIYESSYTWKLRCLGFEYVNLLFFFSNDLNRYNGHLLVQKSVHRVSRRNFINLSWD